MAAMRNFENYKDLVFFASTPYFDPLLVEKVKA
jgi:hypothetical protein